jgi:uncharacterized protein
VKVVIDTSVWIGSLSKTSPYYGIIEAFYDERFIIQVSNEILSEYAEKLFEKYGIQTADTFLRTIMESENVEFLEPYYKWQLIEADKDDNKFVDCAISGNALFIVSNDKHFNILKEIDFPKVEVVKVDDFMKMLGIEKR